MKQSGAKAPVNTTVAFPRWVPPVAVTMMGITVFFLMSLIVASLFGYDVSHGARFLVVIIIALGLALSSAFIGGDAAVRGHIPISFIQGHPITFSATGGIAVFIIVLALSYPLYLRETNNKGEEIKKIALQLRDDFIRERDKLPGASADFSRAEEAIRSLKDIDDRDGHAWYFAGEIRRIKNDALFTSKSCIKAPLKGPVDLTPYENDFNIYLDSLKTLPASETGGSDMGWRICYERASGYCVERTSWIHHLLANDFYQQSISFTERHDRVARLELAEGHAREALKYRQPEEHGRQGFEQCTDTNALLEKIEETLSCLRRGVNCP
jgi:hypothetical protein